MLVLIHSWKCQRCSAENEECMEAVWACPESAAQRSATNWGCEWAPRRVHHCLQLSSLTAIFFGKLFAHIYQCTSILDTYWRRDNHAHCSVVHLEQVCHEGSVAQGNRPLCIVLRLCAWNILATLTAQLQNRAVFFRCIFTTATVLLLCVSHVRVFSIGGVSVVFTPVRLICSTSSTNKQVCDFLLIFGKSVSLAYQFSSHQTHRGNQFGVRCSVSLHPLFS